MDKESFYFQHDYEPTSDPKIQAMLSVHGAAGYGLYWRIIEMLHSDATHMLPRKPYIYMALAKQMETSAEQVTEFINQATQVYELFKADDCFFWSERVLRNIGRRSEISGKRSVAGKISAEKRAEKRAGNSTGVEQPPTSVEQNATKKRKEKKRKGNNTPASPIEQLAHPFSDKFLPHWNKWISYKKEQHRFTYRTIATQQLALDDLIKKGDGVEENAIEIINQSMINGYKGLFYQYIKKPQAQKNDETKMVM